MHAPHPARISWLLPLVAAATLSGCAAMDASNAKAGHIRITSDPAGATAYADGAVLGPTPIEINPADHFRSGFVGLSYRYYGTLTLKKAGCEPWSTDVNDSILSRDVHARLKCDPNYRPDTPAAAKPGSTSGDPTERLERIEALHKKGLISDEEYNRLRTRILDQL